MMYKNAIIALGIVIAITPFLGIPTSWKTGLAVVLGLAVSAIAYGGSRIGEKVVRREPTDVSAGPQI